METVPKLRILVVDDVQEVRQDLRTVLQLTPDLEVLGEATNGIEAVAMAEDLRPDIVLMDLRLPGLDGLEATQQIKRRGLAKGVIVLTIYGQEEHRLQAASAGADAFVEKGIDIETFIRVIREVGQSYVRESGNLPAHQQEIAHDRTV